MHLARRWQPGISEAIPPSAGGAERRRRPAESVDPASLQAPDERIEVALGSRSAAIEEYPPPWFTPWLAVTGVGAIAVYIT